MVDKPLLAIVVPCYNEEEVLPETVRRLTALLEQLLEEGAVAIGSHIVFSRRRQPRPDMGRSLKKKASATRLSPV